MMVNGVLLWIQCIGIRNNQEWIWARVSNITFVQ